MLKISVGHSIDPDSSSAIQEVIETCIHDLDGAIPQAGILFAAPDYDHGLLLDKLNETFPDLELVGGTSNSELSSLEGFQEDSLLLTLFSSDNLEIRAGVGFGVQANPQTAVQQAIQTATHHLTQPLKLCLAFPDGLKANGSSVVDYLQMALPEKLPIVGGTTGEQFQYEATYQFYKNQVFKDAVGVLVFSGDLKLAFGVSSGWHTIGSKGVVTRAQGNMVNFIDNIALGPCHHTIGSKGVVTRAQGNIVYEIDHQPARAFYTKYFGNLMMETADSGLAVFESNEESFYFRAIQQEYDAQATAMSFLGNVPEGATVQLIEGNREDIVEGAKQSIQQAFSCYDGTRPEALLCFSCAGRRVLLGREAKLEYDMISSQLPNPLPSAGFYSYGEIAPLRPLSKSFYHNYTFVSLLLGTE